MKLIIITFLFTVNLCKIHAQDYAATTTARPPAADEQTQTTNEQNTQRAINVPHRVPSVNQMSRPSTHQMHHKPLQTSSPTATSSSTNSTIKDGQNQLAGKPSSGNNTEETLLATGPPSENILTPESSQQQSSSKAGPKGASGYKLRPSGGPKAANGRFDWGGFVRVNLKGKLTGSEKINVESNDNKPTPTYETSDQQNKGNGLAQLDKLETQEFSNQTNQTILPDNTKNQSIDSPSSTIDSEDEFPLFDNPDNGPQTLGGTGESGEKSKKRGK